MLPGTGGTQRLARLVGKARAIQLMCEGTTFDFETAPRLRARQRGLADREPRRVHGPGARYARRFSPPTRAALAVGRIKRAVQTGLEMGLEQGLALERELQAELFASEDAREGLAAYVEKRRPIFQAK